MTYRSPNHYSDRPTRKDLAYEAYEDFLQKPSPENYGSFLMACREANVPFMQVVDYYALEAEAVL